ncbi:UNC5C-like protein [Ptychodera flava]|uniref:UNC5C-like protein n=1 Tax=Ptychodera flava TaxID=63121 RepID=UPI00396A973D
MNFPFLLKMFCICLLFSPLVLHSAYGIPTGNDGYPSCISCSQGIKSCFVCESDPGSMSGTSEDSIRQCPPETEMKIKSSSDDVEDGNVFKSNTCNLATDEVQQGSRWMCCRESRVTGDHEDGDSTVKTDSHTIFYVLIPIMFFIGLFLGILCFYLVYIKRVSIWPKLHSILCPCWSRNWVLSEITMLEEVEEQNNGTVTPIQLVWGPENNEGGSNNATMVGTAPSNGLTIYKKRDRVRTADGGGERYRNKLMSLGRSQNTLLGIPDSPTSPQLPAQDHWDSFIEHHGGDVVLHGPEEGDQGPGVEETSDQGPQFAVPNATDLEQFLGEVNDLAEHATEQNTWKDFNFVGSTFAAGLFDFDGGHLTLDEIGIDLFIPPGALNTRDPELIYIYVSKEHSASLSENHISLSSTIYCGPDGLRFEERLVLSYHHCALNARDVKVVTLFTNTHVGHQPNFRDLATDEACFSFVMGQKCFLFINHFTGFTTVGEGQHVKKMMEVMCFAGALQPRAIDFPIRIYCVNQTLDAKQLVREEEFNRGDQIDVSKQILIDSSNKSDLEFMIKEMSPKGWKVKHSPHQTIKSGILNSGSCGSISYHFIKEDNTLSMLDCSLDFYQHDNDTASEVSPQSILIILNEEKESEETESMVSQCRTKMKHRVQPQFRYSTRLEISQNLDPPCVLGKDWKLFADKIGLDCDTIKQMDDMFKRRIIRSPTIEVLSLWDAQKRTISVDHLKDLKKIFEDMGREDVAAIVQSAVDEFHRIHGMESGGATGWNPDLC